MNPNDVLKPETLTVEKFLGDSMLRKIVPRYQRSYSWEESNVDELLKDIDSAMKSESESYFIGAILCIQREGNKHEIVDGQQRLITISIIFAVALHYLQQHDSKELGEELEIPSDIFKQQLRDFLYCKVGRFTKGDSTSELKLEVSETDKMAYRQIVENPPNQGKVNNKLRNFVGAYSTIKNHFDESVPITSYIKDFIQFLAQNVLLVSINISDEVNAYEIFEVLNARSKELEAVDLIKNKLLSCLSEGDENEVKIGYERWKNVFLVCKERPNSMQEYVRCHLQMRQGNIVPPKKLYKTLNEMLRKKNNRRIAKEFLKELDTHCHKFSAITCKDAPLWDKQFDAGISDVIGYLKEFRVVYTIMLAVLYADKPHEFVFDSYNILQLFMKRTRAAKERFSAMEQYEDFFARIGKEFRQGRGPNTIKEFFKEIKKLDAECYRIIPDEGFISEIANRRRIKDSNAKTILIELANHLQREETTATQIDNDKVTLEHILPRTPKNITGNWPDFVDEETASMYSERLGNLTLLDGKDNTSLSNKNFTEKKRLYAPEECGVRLTNELCTQQDWTRESIKKRQKRLGKLAAEVWSFKKYN